MTPTAKLRAAIATWLVSSASLVLYALLSTKRDWPVEAIRYFELALYSAHWHHLPMATTAEIVGSLLMLVGTGQLWFGIRFGRPFFSAGLGLLGYAWYSSLPVISSGVGATLDALFFVSAGLVLGTAFAQTPLANAIE